MYNTTMEQYILDLTDIQKEIAKEDTRENREKFYQALNKALDLANYLEKQSEKLCKENSQLRDAISIPMPKFKSSMEIIQDPRYDIKTFYWKLENYTYRIVIKSYDYNNWDENFWKKVRWQSYREFLKLIRKEYDENFKTFMENVAFERFYEFRKKHK